MFDLHVVDDRAEEVERIFFALVLQNEAEAG